MPLGRNDPCPCGSGKKYKKCHGLPTPAPGTGRPGVARARTLKAAGIELGDRLQRFALTRFGPASLEAALDAYLGVKGGIVPDAEMQIAIPWALFSLPTPVDDLTLSEVWRRETTNRLTPDWRLLLDAYASMWLSIWEVTDVERGVGSSLVDLLTREERFVYDASSTAMLQPNDAVLAFVLDCEDVSFFSGLHAQPLPPRDADLVAREARRLFRVRTRPVSVDKLRDPELQLDLIALWNLQVDALRRQPPPTMQNTDGDPLVLTTDDYELLAPHGDVSRRLESVDGAQEPERHSGETVFVITKPGNAQHREWENTVVGRIVLTPNRLRTETNSTRRANALRTALEMQLRGAVRFRLRSEANTKSLMEEARASPGPSKRPAKDPMPPEATAMVRAFRQQHMTAWLDDSIPALGGLTPREAARSPRDRQKLAVLLKEFERSEARLPVDEQIDLQPVFDALGFGARRD